MKLHVIISGANGNLGQYVVKKFLQENWQVTAIVQPGTYMENLEKSEHLKIIMLDLNVEQQVATTINELKSKINACVLLAGGFSMGNIENTSHATLNQMIDLNFYTAYHLARPVFNSMKKNNITGRLVFIGAKPALEAESGKMMLPYALSKSMLFKLSEILNAEGKQNNIVSSVVVPSIIDTPANRTAMPDADYSKWVHPENLANLIFLTCSNDGKNLRETVLKVYGES